jgi:hypothetical protein
MAHEQDPVLVLRHRLHRCEPITEPLQAITARLTQFVDDPIVGMEAACAEVTRNTLNLLSQRYGHL